MHEIIVTKVQARNYCNKSLQKKYHFEAKIQLSPMHSADKIIKPVLQQRLEDYLFGDYL